MGIPIDSKWLKTFTIITLSKNSIRDYEYIWYVSCTHSHIWLYTIWCTISYRKISRKSVFRLRFLYRLFLMYNQASIFLYFINYDIEITYWNHLSQPRKGVITSKDFGNALPFNQFTNILAPAIYTLDMTSPEIARGAVDICIAQNA